MLSVTYNKNEPYILMADDDEDDSLFMMAAFKAVGLIGNINRVNNGEKLIVYLKDLIQKNISLPSVIILDLNMPQKDGKEVLKIVRSDSELKQIPIIVYSTSSLQNDILESYKLGCNGYIIKPNNYDEIEKIAEKIKRFFIDSTKNTAEPKPLMFKLDL